LPPGFRHLAENLLVFVEDRPRIAQQLGAVVHRRKAVERDRLERGFLDAAPGGRDAMAAHQADFRGTHRLDEIVAQLRIADEDAARIGRHARERHLRARGIERAVERQQRLVADREQHHRGRMDMHHRLYVRPLAIDGGVNEHLDRRFEALARALGQLAVEVDFDHLVGAGVAHAELTRPARTNKDAVGAGNARTDMPGRGLGEIELAEDAAGLCDARAKIVELAHAALLY
jgi:hypothetical protein